MTGGLICLQRKILRNLFGVIWFSPYDTKVFIFEKGDESCYWKTRLLRFTAQAVRSVGRWRVPLLGKVPKSFLLAAHIRTWIKSLMRFARRAAPRRSQLWMPWMNRL